MYSRQFIDKIKRLYPNSTDMIYHAERGNEILGRLLDDSSPTSINNDRIMNATSLQELQTLALANKQKIELYKEWYEEAKSLFKHYQQ